MKIAVSQIPVNNPLNLTIQPLWDTQLVGTAQVAPIDFFTTQLGQGGKTLVETNMRFSGGLPSPNEFYCRGFCVFPVPRAPENGADVVTDKNDLQRLLERSIFTMYVGTSGRKIVEGHLELFPAGLGLQGFVTTGGATAANVQHVLGNGERSLSNKFGLSDYAEKFNATESFQAQFTFPQGTLSLSNSISVRVYLPGIYGQSIG